MQAAPTERGANRAPGLLPPTFRAGFPPRVPPGARGHPSLPKGWDPPSSRRWTAKEQAREVVAGEGRRLRRGGASRRAGVRAERRFRRTGTGIMSRRGGLPLRVPCTCRGLIGFDALLLLFVVVALLLSSLVDA